MHAAVVVKEREAQEKKKSERMKGRGEGMKAAEGKAGGGLCFPPAACGMWLGGVGH